MKRIIISLFIFFLFQTCSNNPQDNRFLKIDGSWSTFDEFLSLYPIHTFKHIPEQDKEKKINDFLNRQLIIHEAVRKNYLSRSDIQNEFRSLKIRLVINNYFDRVVLDSIITKQRLLTEYENLDPVKKELFTFDEYLPFIRTKLLKVYSNELQQKYIKTIELLKKKYQFSVNPENINNLSLIYINTMNVLKNDSSNCSFLDILKNTNFSESIYSFNGKKYFLNNFINNLDKYSFEPSVQFSNPEDLSKIIEAIGINEIILKESKLFKYNKTDDFNIRFENQKNTILYNKFLTTELTNKINITDDSLRNYYNNHCDSLYFSEPRFEVQEIFLKDKNLATKILTRLKNHDDFQTLIDKYTERYTNKFPKGYLGFIRENMYAGIGRCAAQTNAGDIYPELIPSGQGFSIIKVISVEKSHPIPFDTIKSTVFSDYKDSEYSKRYKELIQSLKDKYKYTINYSLLNI